MKIINIIAALAIAAIIGLFLVFGFFLIKIEPGEVGVRTKQYAVFGEKGVEEIDFAPGWHRNLPLIDSWNVFDATVQTTEFTTPQERQLVQSWQEKLFGDSGFDESSFIPPTGPERIELKSMDGFTVKLDVTVKYRIRPGEGHALYRRFNTEARYKGIVRDQVQDTLRSVFGTMRTEEFYNPSVRREKTHKATETLRNILSEDHIELINILVRDISFDSSYERKILDKKLADQDAELNKSRTVAEEKKGETNKIVAETQAMVRIIEEEKKAAQMTLRADTDKEIAQIKADARVKVSRIKADADLYSAELVAKGDLLEREAEADGELAKAKALQGSGGANLVSLEAIRELKLRNMTVSTLQNDFLDVETTVKKLGAQE